MKKWEDIIKDRLEEYESTLPEGSLADFRALREAGSASPRKKTYPLVWATVAAVAAGLTAILLLRPSATPEEGVRIIQQPPVTQVLPVDNVEVATPILDAPFVVQAVNPRPIRQTAPIREEPVTADTLIQSEEPAVSETPAIPEEPALPEPEESAFQTTASPFIPGMQGREPVKLNVRSGAIAAGGGLLAVLASQLVGGGMNTAAEPNQLASFFYDNINYINSTVEGPIYASPRVNLVDVLHKRPLCVGLSVRVPVWERFGITTGVEYSYYHSVFTYVNSEKQTQNVHYLGIPVRLDWTAVSSRWFDVYLGAGVKGDICIGASFAGVSVGNDGPAFMLLGAGGVQFNATRYLSLYVEPEISWTVPSGRRVLDTYNTEHPWMFSVATGLRINLGKKN